jgi:hypothetical protein
VRDPRTCVGIDSKTERETMRIHDMRVAGIAASLAAAIALTWADAAQAVDWKISGHINRMVRFADDGDKSDIQHLDNSNSQTRIRIKGLEGYGDTGWGFKWETGITSNLSEFASLEQSTSDSQSEFMTRLAYIWYYAPWGKASMGQGYGAAWKTGQRDLSGTYDAQANDSRLWGSINFHDMVGTSSNTAGGLFRGIGYGGEREDRVRYDSPSFGGFKLSASWGNDDEQEYAVKYRAVSRDTSGREWDPEGPVSSLLGAAQMDLALGYTRNTDDTPVGSGGMGDSKSKIATSGSVLWNNGLNLTLAWGQQDPLNATDPTNHAWYSKVGYRTGKNAFSVNYGESVGVPDLDFGGFKLNGRQWGFAYARDMDPYTVYAGAEQVDLERKVPGQPDPDSMRSVVAGVRVDF